MNAEALTAMASGPANAAAQGQHKKTKDGFPTHKVIMTDRTTSLIMLLFIMAMFPAIFAGLARVGISWKAALGGAVCCCVAVTLRILYLNRPLKLPISAKKTSKKASKKSSKKGAKKAATTSSDPIDGVPAAYFLYVCGSGGHTAEMFELIRQSLNPTRNTHRRYIFTTGDNNTLDAIVKFENRVSAVFHNDSGTWDAYQIRRPRNIHQSLLTTPFTALLAMVGICEALTTPAYERCLMGQQKLFKFPHVITTNGPGIGVMTAIVARLLKIFFYAPSNCMKVVFIETWAHVETLSLTGKIFHWGRHVGGIADNFLVQHAPLAEKYGYHQFDFITPRAMDDEVAAGPSSA